MATKCYIAAPWTNKPEALVAKEAFEAAGLEVTANWITRYCDPGLSQRYLDGTHGPDDEQELMRQAMSDIDDISISDIFVILNLAKSEGKAAELGFAYTFGIPTIVVGSRERNIFYYLPGIARVDSVDAAIKLIKDAVDKAEAKQNDGEKGN
jgi:nucleoside 2-deoxyribosyltransferase